MADLVLTSIITLNVSGLNTPIQRQIGRVDFKKLTQLYAVYKKLTTNTVIEAG